MIQIGMFPQLIVFLLFAHAYAQNCGSDNLNVTPGTTTTINSPAYPSNYPPGSQCRWLVSAPVNYQILGECTLEMPATTGCGGDKLLVSLTGDSSLTNADKYCGRQTVTNIRSVGRTMSLALLVATNSPGGRFLCRLVAQLVQQPQECSCGVIKSPRIVGGNETAPNEFISMAGLMDLGNNLFCGGVIIADRYVLTAAHCMEGMTAANIVISVGDSNLQSGLKIRVSTIRIHPNYNSNTVDNDLALLNTATLIPFSGKIGPICLPFRFGNADPTGITVTLLGWGTIFFGGPTSPNLLKTTTRVISQAECRRSLPVTNQQLCTLTPGQDACQLDSGGPVIFFDSTTNRAYIIGIVSEGIGCGSRIPGINTRMQNYTTWTVNNTPGAVYCIVP